MDAGPSVKGADEGRASWFVGTLVVDRVPGAVTGGAFSLTEHLQPPGHETPHHVHRHTGEVFYVLDGEVTVYTDDDAVTATAGETVFLPPGERHGYRVTSDEPARKLVVVWPAGFEEFFHDVGEPAQSRAIPEPSPPDLDTVADVAPDYDVDLLGPDPETAIR